MTIAQNIYDACYDFAVMDSFRNPDIMEGYNEGVNYIIDHEGLRIDFDCDVIYAPGTPGMEEVTVLNLRFGCIEVLQYKEVCHA